MDPKLSRAVETLWDYMQLHQTVSDADCMIALGTSDDRVVTYAAELSRRHHFRSIVMSGGIAHTKDLLATSWEGQTEAAHFAEVFSQNHGNGQVYLETAACNTGQNVTLSHKLLTEKAVSPRSILIVTKPYMERRALATFQAQWPDTHTVMQTSSWSGSFHEYCNSLQPADLVINIMVGDMQRIIEYPALGFQSLQDIPRAVSEAYELLVTSGFTHHMMRS